MKVVSKRDIVELFLKGYNLANAAAVEAENAIDTIENNNMIGEDLKTLEEIEHYIINHILEALAYDIKFENYEFIENIFETIGEEFIIAENGKKVEEDDIYTLSEIILSADKVREIIKENAREIMAIRIIMLRKKRRDEIALEKVDIDNLYAIWKVRLNEIVENELKEFLEEIKMGNTEGISSMADFERILADRIAAKLKQDIKKDFPELVLELFGEGVIFEGADGKEVELDWDNVYEVIPPAIKEMIDEPIDEMARRLMDKPLSNKKQHIAQTVGPIVSIRHKAR